MPLAGVRIRVWPVRMQQHVDRFGGLISPHLVYGSLSKPRNQNYPGQRESEAGDGPAGEALSQENHG